MAGKITVATYKVRIMGPDVVDYPDIELAEKGIEIQVSEVDWNMIENLINDQLPDGWYCKIED